jgi:hypothetical protein
MQNGLTCCQKIPNGRPKARQWRWCMLWRKNRQWE